MANPKHPSTTTYNGELPSQLVPLRTFVATSDGLHHIRATKWMALNPFQLLELMAAMTEDAERLETQGQSDPLRCGPCSLSSKTVSLPTKPKPPRLPNLTMEDDPDEILSASLFLSHPNHGGIAPLLNVGDRTQKFVKISRPKLQPLFTRIKPWNLSLLMRHDPDGLSYLNVIRSSAEYFERYHDVKSIHLYMSLRRDFADQVEFITHHSTIMNPVIRRCMLFKVYQQTVEKMNALIELSHRFTKSKHVTDTNAYMTKWLIANWTNPYPEEKDVEALANACNITAHVVNNWLINIRTRKWRPAIQKAYQLGRPAQFLREDSLKIFQGEDVREIPSFNHISTTKQQQRPVTNREPAPKKRAPTMVAATPLNSPKKTAVLNVFQGGLYDKYSPGSALMIDFATDMFHGGVKKRGKLELDVVQL
jgi:hypothetical protein